MGKVSDIVHLQCLLEAKRLNPHRRAHHTLLLPLTENEMLATMAPYASTTAAAAAPCVRMACRVSNALSVNLATTR